MTTSEQIWKGFIELSAGMCWVKLCQAFKNRSPGVDLFIGIINSWNGVTTGSLNNKYRGFDKVCMLLTVCILL